VLSKTSTLALYLVVQEVCMDVIGLRGFHLILFETHRHIGVA